MANYPRLPAYRMTTNMTAEEVYRELRQFSDLLGYELDTRDAQVDSKPSTNVYTVVVIDLGCFLLLQSRPLTFS